MKTLISILFALFLAAFSFAFTVLPAASGGEGEPALSGKIRTAAFAGGCFWCMESPFDQMKGVLSVRVGYTGGESKNPTYHQVSDGDTGHAEAVEVTYDATMVTYAQLLALFWQQIDPTTVDGQFCDLGRQYRSAIFYSSEEEKKDAENSKAALIESGKFKSGIATEVTAASTFYPAEDYHQHYYKKNPVRYRFYRLACGRDARLDAIWGKDRLGKSPH